MHGLNWQDFGARWLDNVRMQWTTMDPLKPIDFNVNHQSAKPREHRRYF